MEQPRLIITGASGFVGRYLLDAFKEDFSIVAMARRYQLECGAPTHPNIKWVQVDIGEKERLESVFEKLAEPGERSTILIHLAAYYDFTGEDHPEYRRTNVIGFENLLKACRHIRLTRLIFAGSLAACRFPDPGEVITELSPADGDHPYARSKREGEALLVKYMNKVPSCTVRLPAIFSDWCEFPPLFMLLKTWLSKSWNRNLLAGKGRSAVPYLHIRDVISFFRHLILNVDVPGPCEVLICSADGAVSHRELFETATAAFYDEKRNPICVPWRICTAGLYARDLWGRLMGRRPFERPWMARYIDKQLSVNAARTRERLQWAPKARFEIKRRLPFLLENYKTHPEEWFRKNNAALKKIHVGAHIVIHHLLEKYRNKIQKDFFDYMFGPEGRRRLASYQDSDGDRNLWNYQLIIRQLMNAILTREKSVFMAYCRDLAEQRFREGFKMQEVCDALNVLNYICVSTLKDDPEAADLDRSIHNHITLTIQFGIDQIIETFERLEGLEKNPDAVKILQ